MTTTDSQKSKWRKQLQSLDVFRIRPEDVKSIANHPSLTHAKNIGVYSALPPEINIQPLVLHLHTLGKVCHMPVLDTDQQMSFSTFNPNETIIVKHGFMVKKDVPTLPAHRMDCILVPCLGIDNKQKRLGRGKGYYDRILNPRIPTLAIISQAQQIPEDIGEDHDAIIKHVIIVKPE